GDDEGQAQGGGGAGSAEGMPAATAATAATAASHRALEEMFPLPPVPFRDRSARRILRNGTKTLQRWLLLVALAEDLEDHKNKNPPDPNPNSNPAQDDTGG
ncbi:unnamed protein product, partial [Discosporangium mesarthrocarpum]